MGLIFIHHVHNIWLKRILDQLIQNRSSWSSKKSNLSIGDRSPSRINSMTEITVSTNVNNWIVSLTDRTGNLIKWSATPGRTGPRIITDIHCQSLTRSTAEPNLERRCPHQFDGSDSRRSPHRLVSTIEWFVWPSERMTQWTKNE
jgi:hypothetical protein